MIIFFTIDFQIGHENQENEPESHPKVPPVLIHWHNGMWLSQWLTCAQLLTAPFLMWTWRCISWPGQAKQVTGGRRAGVKKKIPGRVDAAGLRGGRWGSGFSLTGGLGEGLIFWNIRRCIQGTVDIKPWCLPWRGGCRVPAGAPRWIPLRFWTVWLHGAISVWEHTLDTPPTESLALSVPSLLTRAPACLIFRHVQLCGLKDCSATCSIPSCFTIPGQMSGGGWP